MADYFLIVNGVKLPVLVRSRVSGSPVEIGSRAEMVDGTLMREIVGYRDHVWSGEIGPFKTAAEAAAIQRLIQGRGQVWSYDEDLYSAAELGPLDTPVATIHPATAADGSPVANAGQFGGSVAVEQASENLLTANQSDVETDTTGFQSVNSDIARVTSDAWEGEASLEVDVDGNAAAEGFLVQSIDVDDSETYSASAYVKGPPGAMLALVLQERDAGDSGIGAASTAFTATGDWQRVSATREFGATGVKARLVIVTASSAQDIVFYADGMQIEQAAFATSWMLGGTSRAVGTLRYDPRIMPQDGFTFAAWWLPQIELSGGEQFFQLAQSDSPGRRIGGRRWTSGQRIAFQVPNATTDADQTVVLNPSSPYDPGDWQFVVFRLSGADYYVRLNDEVDIGTYAEVPASISTDSLAVGCFLTSRQLNGRLDDLLILPYAATDAQIAAWAAMDHPFGPLPRLYVSGRLPDREITDPVLCDGTVTGVRVGVEGRYLQVTLEQVTPSV